MKWQVLKSYLVTKFRHFKSREELIVWQLKQWQSFQGSTLVKSPFYKPFIGLPLKKWPVVSKCSHMENFNQINTQNLDRDKALAIAIESETNRNFNPSYLGYSVGLSSGTSGNKGLFVASEKERAEWAGTIVAKMLPFKFKKQRLAFFLRANNNLYETVQSQYLNFEFFDLITPFNLLIEELNKFNPDILIAPAQVLRLLAEAQDNSLNINPKRIISVAEVLEIEDRVFISKIFETQIHQIYQCTEGLLACTCQFGELHLNEDLAIIKKHWLDEEKTRFMPIITDFKRTTQPIINYRLDDILVIDNTPCQCGSVYTKIKKIEGRCDDILKLRSNILSGDTLSLINVFPDFIRNAIITHTEKLNDYCVIQVSENELLIKLQPLSETNIDNVTKAMDILWSQLKIEPPILSFSAIDTQILSDKKRRVQGLKGG